MRKRQHSNELPLPKLLNSVYTAVFADQSHTLISDTQLTVRLVL